MSNFNNVLKLVASVIGVILVAAGVLMAIIFISGSASAQGLYNSQYNSRNVSEYNIPMNPVWEDVRIINVTPRYEFVTRNSYRTNCRQVDYGPSRLESRNYNRRPQFNVSINYNMYSRHDNHRRISCWNEEIGRAHV